jgi:signal transduction histidine kinase
MSRLFGRFQRLSAQPTAGESSTGLGLSIAKKNALRMGGDGPKRMRLRAQGPGGERTITLRPSGA